MKYVGESYSGEYIANHVIHEFSVYGGYTTTVYLKRNMAGGEKKRVSPIDSEMMRERLRRMEERMHGPVEQEDVAVDEEVVEPALATETAPPAESQETGEEVVFLRGSNEQFVQNMRNLIGTPYVWGGDDPTINGGVDCSGSILYALNQMGNGLLDQRAWQIYSNLTLPVDDGDIQAGYLRFLRNANGEINHVQVIVAEDGSRVNASGTDANTRDNPGIIELLSGPLPQNGEIRRLQFRE